MLSLLILSAATMLHIRRLPYSMSTLSLLELLSLLNSCLTYFLGQFTLDAGTFGQSFQDGASILALSCNLMFLVIALGVGVSLYSTCVQQKLQARADKAASEKAAASYVNVHMVDTAQTKLESREHRGVQNIERVQSIELSVLPTQYQCETTKDNRKGLF